MSWIDLPDTGPRLRDLEVRWTGREWAICWSRGGPVHQGGFATKDEASDYLWSTYDDCD